MDVRRGDARRSTARYVLLHERLVPYVRAAAATAARCGLPIVRPRRADRPRRGWAVADAYGYGPSLWVAPVLEDGAREVEVDLPAGDWIDDVDRAEVAGGGEVAAPAPLERDPGVGAARRDHRHLPGGARRRAGSATRPSASARWRRRCGASRRRPGG